MKENKNLLEEADALETQAEVTEEGEKQSEVQQEIARRVLENIKNASDNIDQNEGIKDYDENQIQVLEGLEAVRKRPGMYIGSTGPRGLHHLVYEIVDNSIDEAMAKFCDEINVEILPGDIIRVSDNGRGIPVGIHPQKGIPTVTVVFTVLHAGGKFGGGAYKVSGGLHGVGASVVNALSEWLEVEIHHEGKIYSQRYERGNAVNELKIIGDTEKRGTVVTFKPDGEIFEETVFDYETLLSRLREQAFLNAGLCIKLSDKRDQTREENRDELCYEGGIRSFVEFLQKKTGNEALHPQVIHINGNDGSSMAEVALQYNDSYNEVLYSFANDIRTIEGGTHETGFKAALTRVFNEYGRKKGLLKDSDRNLSGEDCREGLTAVISVKLQEAQFEGQTKAKLGNTEIRTLVESIVYDKLMTFFEETPSVAKAIFEKAVNAARVRDAARKARDLARRKSALETTSLPGKLADCSDRNTEYTELYIVEGDSAGGSAKQGRDRRFQAILSLWGKMLNVEKARIDKVYGNEKLMPVVTALGTGLGEEFDISKLRYGKVVIMADADVDGLHIRTLMLTFFFRFMRPLIEHGKVYIAQPPLYRLTKGKKHFYAYSDRERDELMAEHGSMDIQRYKGLGEMDPEQLWETTLNPENRTMLRVEMEDAAKADEIFTILMGDKVEPRREFIQKNARYVTNLDI